MPGKKPDSQPPKKRRKTTAAPAAARSAPMNRPDRKPKESQRLTAVAKVKRDAELILDKTLGLTWPQIVAKYDISKRQAQNIYYAWRDDAMEAFNEQDALVLSFEVMSRYEAVEARALHLIENGDNDNVKLGALRLLVNTTEKRVALHQALGKLPHNLGILRHEIDVRHVAQVLVGVMREYEMPVEAQRKVQDVLRGKLPPPAIASSN